jgi:predicted TPR repeat methyltransferase
MHELKDMQECRVLDLGCGTGLNVKLLCEHRGGIHAEGIDVSPRMIERAQATGKYERLSIQDLEHRLPSVASDSFDLVVAFGFLEFLTDIHTCLSECRRALKDNGALWATLRRFEPEDIFSPPRVIAGSHPQVGYSASEILYMMSCLDMRVTGLDSVVGYLTVNGFACPYYVLQARKTSVKATVMAPS